jgi:hypothetical protein
MVPQIGSKGHLLSKDSISKVFTGYSVLNRSNRSILASAGLKFVFPSLNVKENTRKHPNYV